MLVHAPGIDAGPIARVLSDSLRVSPLSLIYSGPSLVPCMLHNYLSGDHEFLQD